MIGGKKSIGIDVSMENASICHFPRKMTKGSPEFRAGAHVHNGIVDSVEEEGIAQVGHDLTQDGAVTPELDAPVNSNRRARYGESAKPKRQDIDGHADGRLEFESADFWATLHPGEEAVGVDAIKRRR